MSHIHKTAIIEEGAVIGKGTTIGPYCVISSRSKIGENCTLLNHVTLMGDVEMGTENRVLPNVVIGAPPQDISHKGDDVKVVIGNGNLFRESVTINAGSHKEEGITRVGNYNMIMAYCHIAHDCWIGDHVIMANGVQIGGHCTIKDYVNFGGLAAIHHFATIGELAFIGGLSRIIHDVPPYMIAEGHPSKVKAVNVVGLKRKGLSEEDIRHLKDAYTLLYRSGEPKVISMNNFKNNDFPNQYVKNLVEFLREWLKSNQGRIKEMYRKVPVIKNE